MKTNLVYGLAMAAVLLGSAVSVMAQENSRPSSDAVEVSALIKCHEGKFDAMNAVSQLTGKISGEMGDIYGWSGIGAYPDGHTVGHLVFVRQPVKISAPTFVQVKDTTWACVTVQRQ